MTKLEMVCISLCLQSSVVKMSTCVYLFGLYSHSANIASRLPVTPPLAHPPPQPFLQIRKYSQDRALNPGDISRDPFNQEHLLTLNLESGDFQGQSLPDKSAMTLGSGSQWVV